MDPELIYLFVPACLALGLAPGPSNVLALGNGARHGVLRALVAGTGRLAAFAGVIALVCAGLAAAMERAPGLFTAIQVAGLAYIAWLGVRALRRRRAEPDRSARPRGLGQLTGAEFLLGAGNPKVLVAFTAVLPPFLDAAAPAAPQLAVAALLFLLAECAVILAYAAAGAAAGAAGRRPGVRRALARLRPGPRQKLIVEPTTNE